MKKRTVVVILTMFVIAFLICGVALYLGEYWSILPTKSSSEKVTLVAYNSPYTYPSITIKNYMGKELISEYVLDIKTGMSMLEVQKYKLPKTENGSVEIIFNEGNDTNDMYTISYDSAEKFYKNGLLIYTTDNDSNHTLIDGKDCCDKYVYFVSGDEKVCYFKESGADKSVQISDMPKLKHIRKDPGPPYIYIYNGWKENNWVRTGTK